MIFARVVPLLALLAFCSLAESAEALRSVQIWHAAHQAPVAKDMQLPFGVVLEIYDVEMLANANRLINNAVRPDVSLTADPDTNYQAYSQAASKYAQSEDFKDIIDIAKDGAIALRSAVDYKVTKIPAIVVNEKYVIYGVNSLDRAIEIFKERIR